MTEKEATKKPEKDDGAIEQRVKEFGEEVQTIGDKIGKKVERKGKEYSGWFGRTFGVVGPLISSVVGLIILGLVAWILNFVNTRVGSGFMTNVHTFLMGNFGMFFLIFLLFSYASYFSRISPKMYRPFSPIVAAIGVTVAFWIVMNALLIADLSLRIPWFSAAASMIGAGFLIIFLLAIIVGYTVLIMKMVMKIPGKGREEAPAEKAAEREEPSRVHRLYRSGRDRILGGVCGGIAEYMGVDPVIIRLLWILGSLLWGFGVILYIICWVIMPRNPRDKW